MSGLSAVIASVGLLGPGFRDWDDGGEILSGRRAYGAGRTVIPVAAALPPAERRRAGRVIHTALAVGAEALRRCGADGRTLPTVFASSSGDGDNCHEICVALAAEPRQISPTRFTNSVHNAAAGYWSIAHGCREASTALCAGDASFGAGLLEAGAQLTAGAASVLLLCYDTDYPPPLRAKQPVPDAFGAALLLTSPSAAAGLAGITLALSDTLTSTPMADSGLEALRRAIPAARCLPLLQSLARQQTGPVVLDYLRGLQLAIELRT
ncbi:MAG: beta-ketoacyl synthase chain length factor [Steroidobacteraceae bacterium]